MTKAPLAILAAGGTGGHMFPAQALAEELLDMGWRVKLTTDPRGARYVANFPDAVSIEVLKSGTFARGGILSKLMVPFQIGIGTLNALVRMLLDRPTVVVGFGGYPSIPAMAAAVILRRPRILHEQNGVLGRVNQIFAKWVDCIACGTWPTQMPAGLTAEHIGNPVRGAVRDRAGAGYIPPGDYPMSILVMGGSQGARILSDVVPPAIAQLPMDILRHIRVSHQARDEDHDRVSQFYAENGIAADVQPFFDDVPTRMSETQLVISRAGASSVADISVIGRPSILVPLAAALRDEQTANAQGLVQGQAAILIPESQFHVDSLAQQIKMVLTQPEAAHHMARQALSLGIPDAGERLAALVVQVAQSRGVLDHPVPNE